MTILSQLGNLVSGIIGRGAKEIRKPVFIVGCGRSGTTMLFNLLSKHPALACTTGYPDGEDHVGWIEHGKCLMAGLGNVNSSKYGSGINGHNVCAHMTSEDLTGEVVEAMHNYYWNDVLKHDKTRRVINKCPHNSNKLDYMLGIFPDARIIHIIRDCKPMVASWIAQMDTVPNLAVYVPKEEEFPCLWLFQQPDEPAQRAVFARQKYFSPGAGDKVWVDYWNKTNLGIEKQMSGKLGQLLCVRYEDLVANPGEVLNAIMDFCELPFYEFETRHIEKDTGNKHLSRISPELEELIKNEAKNVRAHFGYEPSIPGAGSASRLYKMNHPVL